MCCYRHHFSICVGTKINHNKNSEQIFTFASVGIVILQIKCESGLCGWFEFLILFLNRPQLDEIESLLR
jgi:hypothetical protein